MRMIAQFRRSVCWPLGLALVLRSVYSRLSWPTIDNAQSLTLAPVSDKIQIYFSSDTFTIHGWFRCPWSLSRVKLIKKRRGQTADISISAKQWHRKLNISTSISSKSFYWLSIPTYRPRAFPDASVQWRALDFYLRPPFTSALSAV